jgi:hypothetical protein
MARPEVTNRYYSGQGICMMAERSSAGEPLGLLPIGNVSALSLAITQTTEEHKESYSGTRGVDVSSVTETAVAVSITFESIQPENLILGLNGSNTDRAAATSVVVSTKFYLGKWTMLPYTALSNVSIEDDSSGTLVEDTDYELDAANGLIKLLDNTNKADGVATDVTFDHGQSYELQALVTSAPERFFLFSGLNTHDDKAVQLIIPRLQTQPFGALPMINDGIGSFEMTANALADSTITGAGKSKFFSQIIQA